MTDKNIDFETLNAYVDGELDSGEAADVALAIAGNPHLAQQVAVLTGLRSAVIEAVETPEIDFNEAPAKRRRPTWHKYAASIAFLILLAGSTLVLVLPDRPVPPRWFDVAVNLLETWPDESEQPALSVEAIGPVGAFAGAYIPDLSAAKLIVNHVAAQTSPSLGKLEVIGYRGTRGCRIALAVFADGGTFPLERARVSVDGTLAFSWRVGRLGYAIIADGMDVARFRLIAETVHEATKRQRPTDAETRVALGESRQRSMPCVG